MLRDKTLTSSWYSDEKILKIEKENIFSKSWHLLGSIDRIPNKGDYLIKTINEQPIIVIKDKVGKITKDQIKKIAELKMPDLNAINLESAMSMVSGTARSMGIKVEK